MKAFISGATGVLGRRVVAGLVAGGHQVVGLSRSQTNVDQLAGQGAEGRMGDLFDAEKLSELASDCDAVLHLATAIPTKARSSPADWAMNDRIRREGTRAMVEAALRGPCRLYVQQSVTFVYGDRGGAWVDEDSPLGVPVLDLLQSAIDMEHIVGRAGREQGLPAVTLRFGSFYSHDSAQTRTMLDLTKKGRFPVVGDGHAFWSMLHVDDAASAIVRAIDRPADAAGQIFNVCDDEPVEYGDLVGDLAAALGARKPMHLPTFPARLLLGTDAVRFLQSSVRCRNQRIKDRLGWQPRYPTHREGFRAVIDAWSSS